MKHDVWYDKVQFTAMLLMAAVIPVSWQLGVWVALLLAVASGVKLVASRRVGNPALGRGLWWPLCLMVVYWLVNVMGVLYSSDSTTAWSVVGRKSIMLIFAFSFLFTDTRYITAFHLRMLGYALLMALAGVIFFYTGKSLIRMMEGANFASAFGRENVFDPRHHAYMALYAISALIFIYYELAWQWGTLKPWLRGVLVGMIPLVALYVVLVNSRAGILSMILVVVACVLHQVFVKHRWWLAVVATVLLVGGYFGMSVLLPGHSNRITDTLHHMQGTEKEDERFKIMRSAMRAIEGSPIVGYGTGDYQENLAACYCQDNCDSKEGYNNAHNQYAETMLAVGAVGLLPYLAMLLLPLVLAIWRRSRYGLLIFMFTLVIMFNLLFESMLERQMGLQIMSYLMVVMVLILSVEQEKQWNKKTASEGGSM